MFLQIQELYENYYEDLELLLLEQHSYQMGINCGLYNKV